MHLNILKPADLPKETFFEQCNEVSKWVFEIVQQHQGSISAEHGVGMTKKPYLHYSRSAAEINYCKAIKKAFDPNNIMNPGKLFDQEYRRGVRTPLDEWRPRELAGGQGRLCGPQLCVSCTRVRQ